MNAPTSAAPSLSLHALAAELGLEPPSGEDIRITGVATLEDAGPQDVAFLANPKYVEHLATTRAGAVLVAEGFNVEATMPLLRTPHPRVTFAKLLERFHPRPRPAPGIHPTAVVPESAKLGADVHLGAYTVLGEDVVIGDRTVLHPHVVVYDDVRIGDDTEIHSHVSIRHGTRIGNHVIIHDGAVLGADGFGFEPDEHGRLHKVPQVGIVRIEDDVELQAHVAVDRAALGETRVGENTKVDNFAQIAHGCTIGHSTIICGQVGLAGSTHVGNRVMLGGQAGFSGHTKVGDGAMVAAQSGIMRDLEPGKRYAGSPAFEAREMMRTAGLLPKMPELFRRMKRLEEQVARLQGGD